MRLSLPVTFAFAAICCVCSSASAQTGQLSGGAAGGGAGAGGTTAQAGSTTQGPGGLTTQGPAGANGATGGNTTPGFIGGFDPSAAFVGGGTQTQRNNARQFQAITVNGVPVGGTFETSGTPRQIPVSLKVGFAFPAADGSSQLLPSAAAPIQQVAVSRPEFRSVQVQVTKGVAVLVGQVPTEASRRLAANLVRLRPGVRSVDNRILIAQPAMTPRPVLPQ